MKITGIKLYRYTAPYRAKWPGAARSCGPLDISQRGRLIQILKAVKYFTRVKDVFQFFLNSIRMKFHTLKKVY